jgi:hypothetical protein
MTFEALLNHVKDDADRRHVLDLATRVYAATGKDPIRSSQQPATESLLHELRERLAWNLRAKRYPLPGAQELRELIRQHFDDKP